MVLVPQSACDVAESTIPVTDDLSHVESLSVISHIAVWDDDRTASWASSHSCQTVFEDDLFVVDHDTVTSAFSLTVPVPTSSHDPVVDNNSDNRYITRLGRVIKPVRQWFNSKPYLVWSPYLLLFMFKSVYCIALFLIIRSVISCIFSCILFCLSKWSFSKCNGHFAYAYNMCRGLANFFHICIP